MYMLYLDLQAGPRSDNKIRPQSLQLFGSLSSSQVVAVERPRC